MIIREFRKGDCVIDGHTFDPPFIGISILSEGGGMLGFGLITHQMGKNWAMFDWFNGSIPKFIVHRAAFKLFGLVKKMGLKEVFVIRDPSKPRSAEWLKRLGFRPMTVEERGFHIRFYEVQIKGGEAWVWGRS